MGAISAAAAPDDAGDLATRTKSMLDEGQRIAQALQDLAKIHPEAAETFEFGISYDWALDRHGGGIGPLFRPLEMTSRFYDDIVRPVGRIWFASDACSRLARRWIEGAIASAVTNAYAIQTGMRDALPAVTWRARPPAGRAPTRGRSAR